MAHGLDGELVGDDLGAAATFVAIAMVAIVMGVDDGSDRRRRLGFGLAHGCQHLAGQRHVEQRVDQEGLAAVDDQAGVRPAPAAIGLQPGIAAIAEIVQALGVLKLAEAESHDLPPQDMPVMPLSTASICAVM